MSTEITTRQIQGTNLRSLVTVRQIRALCPIDGADAIELAQVEGWKVVVKKGEFNVGDNCVYFEIDSFLPDGNPVWQFLVDKSPKIMDGKKGHKLRTVKLRGQISQGFVMPISAVPSIRYVMHNEEEADWVDIAWNSMTYYQSLEAIRILEELHRKPELTIRDIDFSFLLGVEKYEAPIPTFLQGMAEGLFPSFLSKSDQERCQNLQSEIFGYEAQVIPADEQVGRPQIINPAKASPNTLYEVTMKLDGSSMTAFVRKDGNEIKTGVCSRNLQLKVCEANAGNSFVRVFQDTGLEAALLKFNKITGRSIAVQGEIVGPSIQCNREQLTKVEFFVYDIFDIDTGVFAPAAERMEIFNELQNRGARINHVPILHTNIKLQDLNLNCIDDILSLAEGPSIKHSVREGLVFKRIDGQFSFKAISNQYLAKERD